MEKQTTDPWPGKPAEVYNEPYDRQTRSNRTLLNHRHVGVLLVYSKTGVVWNTQSWRLTEWFHFKCLLVQGSNLFVCDSVPEQAECPLDSKSN